MIVKMQKPLAGNGEPLMLIYNEDRSFEVFQPYTKKIEKKLFKGRDKIYCEVKKEKDPVLNGYWLRFIKEVEEQGW